MEMPVLVLGMHRSGTSALTRCINLLGVPLGVADDLMPTGEANPRGYWESASLTRVSGELVWSPSDDFETGLTATIESYKGHKDWLDRIVLGAYRAYYEER